MKQLFNDPRVDKNNPMGKDKKYSRAIRVPQYTPSKDVPSLTEMFDLRKYSKLVARIKRSNVSDDEKKFLFFAATRHIVFTFSKIADYYAHADKEMQELMEESALVILDMDDAIANGYVALSEKMQQLIKEEKERDQRAREAKKVLKEQRRLLQEKLKQEQNKELKEEKRKEEESIKKTINEDEGFLIIDDDILEEMADVQND